MIFYLIIVEKNRKTLYLFIKKYQFYICEKKEHLEFINTFINY